MHLDDDRRQRLLDDELTPEEERSARAHLATCADCRVLVSNAERDDARVHELLQRLDHPVPSVHVDAVVVLATRETDRWISVLDSRPRWQWAAAVAIAVSVLAVAAYAIPGSPVRAWVAAVRMWAENRRSPSPAPTGEWDAALRGVAVVPGDALVIEFTSPQAGGGAIVRLDDGDEVVARTRDTSTSFITGPDRLVIDNRGSSRAYDIRVPKMAARVEVRLGGATLYLKEGPRVTTSGQADGTGAVYLSLASPKP